MNNTEICPSTLVASIHCQCAVCNPNFVEEFLSADEDANEVKEKQA